MPYFKFCPFTTPLKQEPVTIYETGKLVELTVIISEPTTDSSLLNYSSASTFNGLMGKLTFITQKSELLWLLCPFQVMVAINAHSWLLLNMEAKQVPQ